MSPLFCSEMGTVSTKYENIWSVLVQRQEI